MTAEDWEAATVESAVSFARRVIAGNQAVEFVGVRSAALGRIASYRHSETGLQFVLVIPQGEQAAQSGGPPFLICSTEVPQSVWRLQGRNPSRFVGDNLPAEGMTFDEARRWCDAMGLQIPTDAEWLSALPDIQSLLAEPQLNGNMADQSLVLRPTEETGGSSVYWPELLGLARYDDNYAGTAPCGRFRPSRWGLFDALGNVWEWCADPARPGYQVIRGGSWNTPPTLHVRILAGEGRAEQPTSGTTGIRPVIRLQPTSSE